MIVERIWTGNAYRNFNYLIACPETGEALAIDPLDHDKCLNAAKVRGWQITQVLNTHEHHDHTGGNEAVIKATGAKLLAHHKSGSKIRGVDRGLAAGDIVKVGRTVELECLDTPGHTMCHICLRSHTDTAGAVLRRHAVQRRRRQLPQRRRPGRAVCHLRRAAGPAARQHAGLSGPRLHREQPEVHAVARAGQRRRARRCCRGWQGQDPATSRVTTLAEEKQFNTFFRLGSASVIAKLREAFPDLPEQPDAQTVFVKLRELRNSW